MNFNRKLNRNAAGYCFLSFGLISMSAWALPEDARQPIYVDADQAEIDKKQRRYYL